MPRRLPTLATLGLAVSFGLALGLTQEGTALAQPKASAGDGALAEALFRDAKALMQQNKHAEACPKLEESQRLDPGGGTQLTLALCYEGAGRFASAWAAFSEALTTAKRDNRPERAKIAQDKIDAVAAKMAYLTVVVPPEVASASPEVKRDGSVLRPTVWGSAIPVDPGEHVVEVTASGKKKWARKVTAGGAEGLKITLKVPKLEDEDGGAKQDDPGGTKPPEGGPAPDSGGGWKKPTGITLLVVGAIGVGVGSYFGFSALSKRKDADALCPAKECPDPKAISLVDESKSAATISTIGIGAGVGLAVVGAVLLVTAPKAAPSTSALLVPRRTGVSSLTPSFAVDSRGGSAFLGGHFLADTKPGSGRSVSPASFCGAMVAAPCAASERSRSPSPLSSLAQSPSCRCDPSRREPMPTSRR